MGRDPDVGAEQSRSMAAGPNSWSRDPLLWPFAATRLAMDACLWWMEREAGSSASSEPSALDWSTPNHVALELATLRLREFSCGLRGHPALICAPYALHRALIADFAPGHSLVEALQQGGVDRLFLTDWRSASSEMRYLTIDNYLADLNVVIDSIGPPVDLVGLCQGGWMSLLYAARFPEKVRRLVLVGTPVNLSIESELSNMVSRAGKSVFEALVTAGGGLARGSDLVRLWRSGPDIEAALQRDLPADDAAAGGLRERFARWHAETLDLPGAFYLETVEKIFRENRLANGTLVALGREVQLSKVTAPVFLLTGSNDEIVPQAQAMATAPLLGTPRGSIAREITPSSHVGLFMGRTTITTAWLRVAEWLTRDQARTEVVPRAASV